MIDYWFIGFILIGMVYFALILWLFIGIKRIPKPPKAKEQLKTGFSILIAFRNEANNLDALLQSIAKIDYPKELFEVLLVNDASTDRSTSIVKGFIASNKHFSIKLLDNDRQSISPKKDAINTAIKVSKFGWIVTTDADCIVSNKWLASYHSFILKSNTVFIAGLVSYQEREGFIHQFQQLDWNSLLGVTLGSFGWNKPLLCSGANLAYQKEAFYKVNGFAGNDHIASGDDVFLMQKMQEAFPNQVSYLNSPNALVQTQSVDTWKDLYQQRIRWGNKTSSLQSLLIKLVGLIVFLFNLSLITLLLLAIYKPSLLPLVFGLFVLKIIFDGVLLKRVSNLVNQKINLSAWLLSSSIYPFFSVSVVFLGLFSNYTWKGRKFGK